MFNTHRTTIDETANSSDHSAWVRKRKVPRLSLATDMKSLQTPSTFMLHSPSTTHPQIEVDEIILYENNFSQAGATSNANPTSRGHPRLFGGGTHCSPDLAYPPLLSSSFLAPSTTARNSEISSIHRYSQFSPSYPHQIRDTQLDTTHHRRPPLCVPYPSPPQSTAASPLETSHPLPSPVKPSPSLPLHQPRPCRRIPIVSLSQLASACEDMEKASPRRPVTSKHRAELASRSIYSSNHRHSPYSKFDRDKQVVWSNSRQDSRVERTVRCGCGCMEPYPTC